MLRPTIIAALCGMLAIPLAAQPPSGPPPANVVVDAARLETIEQWREVTGEFRAVRRATLAAETEGLIVEILVDPGDRVEAGQTIARLRNRLATLELQRAEAVLRTRDADVEVRRAELEREQRDLDRLRSLLNQGATLKAEIEDATSDVRSAEARVRAAEAQQLTADADKQLAAERLEQTVILAPFTGTIIAKSTEVGQWVREGDIITELLETDQIEAWLDVPEQVLAPLRRPDAKIRIEIRAIGETIDAPVSAIIPRADELSRLFPVRSRMPNPDLTFAPGMSLIGLVPTGIQGESLTVHKDAIRRDDAGTFVFTDAGGRAAAVRVDFLFATRNRVAVRAPRLQPGTPVIIEGNETVYPGQPLNIIDGAAQKSTNNEPAAPVPPLHRNMP